VVFLVVLVLGTTAGHVDTGRSLKHVVAKQLAMR